MVIEKSGKSEKELSEVLQAALSDATSQKLPADIFKVSKYV